MVKTILKIINIMFAPFYFVLFVGIGIIQGIILGMFYGCKEGYEFYIQMLKRDLNK